MPDYYTAYVEKRTFTQKGEETKGFLLCGGRFQAKSLFSCLQSEPGLWSAETCFSPTQDLLAVIFTTGKEVEAAKRGQVGKEHHGTFLRINGTQRRDGEKL